MAHPSSYKEQYGSAHAGPTSFYRPAYELVEEDLERAGRGKIDPTPAYVASKYTALAMQPKPLSFGP